MGEDLRSSSGLTQSRTLGRWEVKRSDAAEVPQGAQIGLDLAPTSLQLTLPSGHVEHSRYRDCEFYNNGRREGRLVIGGVSIWLRSLDGINAAALQGTIFELRDADRRAGPQVGQARYPKEPSHKPDGSSFFWGTVLASSQLPSLPQGRACFLLFDPEGVTIGTRAWKSEEDEIQLSYEEITSLQIGGRGILARTSGGGFIGGGFGVQGSAEGMLVASALNVLTTKTRTTVETIVELGAGPMALLLLHGDQPPDQLRTHLAPAFAWIEAAHRRAPASATAGSPATPDRLAQLKTLGELRDSGVLTPEEFEAEKARVLRS